ncbi:MAG TPA: branched-chain amino acid ABC transporter permease, partial [Candidatus Thermoplasmatota archaeon]|nr:branched-chain amino acid ABC transporter permease [Candidatus Thermoplasmatota archaeon]
FPFSTATAPNGVVLLGVVAGVILAALASLLLGIPAIRLREDYLAIVTLGAAEIFRSFVGNEEAWTRGTLGIVAVQRPLADWARESAWWNTIADSIQVRPIALAHVALGLLLVAFVFLMLETLARSPWGRVLKAVREDDAVASSLGKNVTVYKLEVLMIGASLAAVAGILAAWNVNSVFPEHFLTATTFFAFIILVIGGIGNHKGALLGAILLWGIFELAGNLTTVGALKTLGISFAGPIQNIFVGVVLILIMLVRPHGAIGRKEELVLGK